MWRMLELIPAELLTGAAGASAILSITVSLVLFGKLIPRQIHLDRVIDKNEQIAYLQKTIDKRDEQIAKLLDQGNLTVTLLDQLNRQLGLSGDFGPGTAVRPRRPR